MFRPCNKQKHVRFEDEHLCESTHGYNFNAMRATKIRKTEGKTPEEFGHSHVGDKVCCTDNLKRTNFPLSPECDRASRKCKYSNNYPSARIFHNKFSSIYV